MNESGSRRGMIAGKGSFPRLDLFSVQRAGAFTITLSVLQEWNRCGGTPAAFIAEKQGRTEFMNHIRYRFFLLFVHPGPCTEPKSGSSLTGTGCRATGSATLPRVIRMQQFKPPCNPLALQRGANPTCAFEARPAIGERDSADHDPAPGNPTRSDLIPVRSALRRGSENHKSAFLRQLGR
jgi:hypothetical protein